MTSLRKNVVWKKGQPLIFQADSWTVKDEKDDETGKHSFVMRVFGTTLEGYSVHLKITDYTPFFYIEIPEEKQDTWTITQTNQLRKALEDILVKADKPYLEKYYKSYVQEIKQIQITKKTHFFGYTQNTKAPFLRVICTTQRCMKRLVRQLRNHELNCFFKKRKYKTYEGKLEPLLRFYHITNITPCGWMCIKKIKKNDEATTQIDAFCSWKKVKNYPEFEDKQAPKIVSGVDIECYSHDYVSFPDALNVKDKIIQIGVTTNWYANPEYPGKNANDCNIVHQWIGILGKATNIEPSSVIYECFEKEEELLLRWFTIMNKIDPDYIVGHNIFGFDWYYIYQRAKIYGLEFSMGELHRLKGTKGIYEEKKMSSSAYGDNTYKMIKMIGRICIDTYKHISREHKLASYTLNNVSKHFLGMNKIDLPAKQIFQLQDKGDKDRGEIATYCIRDCELCNHLMYKLDVLTSSIGMANVCLVPIEYLFIRGQGIKTQSLVAGTCYKLGIVMKDLYPDDYPKATFEGALVITPQKGFHTEPVTVCDFSSLYPSIIISENLSPDTIVQDKKYKFMIDEGKCNTIEYNKNDEKVSASFVRHTCKEEQGIVPRILIALLSARKDKKKLMKNAKDPFKKKMYNSLQLAYKVSANSIYGALGARTSAIYCPEAAASTTAKGREHLQFSRKFIEDNYEGCETVYGDSVIGDTPLLLRIDGKIVVKRIETLATEWKKYHNDKECCELQNVESWTEDGWTKVHRVIRHKLVPSKGLVEILTHTGHVVCTTDHSLILENGKDISPNNLKEGDILLHSCPSEFPSSFEYQGKTINNEKLSRLMGMFFGCGKYKDSFTLTVFNTELIPFYKNILEEIFPESQCVIENNTIIDNNPFIELWKYFCYNDKKEKIIPPCILQSDLNIRREFYEGLKDSNNDIFCSEASLSIVILLKSLGYNDILVEKHNDKFIIKKEGNNENPGVVKKINKVTEYQEYVYDLTTENHHFHAGVGTMIVHNTDSVFMKFKLEEGLTKEEKILKCVELGKEASKRISETMKPPMNLEYEKVLLPLLLVTRKRYVGNLYEEDPTKYVRKSMGLVTKRRDNANIVKIIYNGILDILLDGPGAEGNKELAISESKEFFKNMMCRLCMNDIPIPNLVISKTLRKKYKNPGGIAHAVLSKRMHARKDPRAPQVNDRVPYVFVIKDSVKRQKKLKQGDRIEHPEYVKEQNLDLDVVQYIEHVRKPVTQLLEFIADDPKEWFLPFKQRAEDKQDDKYATAEELADKVVKSWSSKPDWQIVLVDRGRRLVFRTPTMEMDIPSHITKSKITMKMCKEWAN